jgi:hypothetical protein
MARYRRIDVRLWGDTEFLGLSLKAKLAWVYLLTSDQVNLIGLYRLSVPEMAAATGLPEAVCRTLLAEFEERGMIRYDDRSRLVWLRNWLRYNQPEGPKQVKGYASAASEFLPEAFARAFLVTLWPLMEGQPGPATLTKKQAIIIRDGVRCVYCGRDLTEWDQLQIDHVIPESKKAENGKYEDLVTSCVECNRRKGGKTAEEFGFPFVSGRQFSLGRAAHQLVFNAEVRQRYAQLVHGLPGPIAGIESIAHLLPRNGYLEGNTYPFDTHPSEYRFQEQEQEQEQEHSPPKPPQGGGGASADGESFEKFWQVYPRREAKEAARRAWRKLAPTPELQEVILAAIERQKQSEQWQREVRRYVPLPGKWLNERRWEDETGQTATAPSPDSEAARLARVQEQRRQTAELYDIKEPAEIDGEAPK